MKGIKIISLIAALTLMAGVASGCGKKEKVTVSEAGAKVEQSVSEVTGVGILEAEHQFTISASVPGDVISAPFENGQQVNQGDVLFALDQAEMLNNLKKATLGVETAQLGYRQTADAMSKLNITASISGTLDQIMVSKGAMVAPGTPVASVINNTHMLLKVPFIKELSSGFYVGQSAQVNLVGSFYQVNGTISKIASGQMVTAGGTVVTMVEINVPNPGTISKGDKGTAVVGGVACTAEGDFDYSDSRIITAEGSGKVAAIPRMVGDAVSAGTQIIQLSNDALSTQQQQNAVAVQQAQTALEGLQIQMKNFNIPAPITGTFLHKKVKTGDTLTAANMGALALVADLSSIQFKMDVDEMDVAKVKVEQLVTFTTDALPGRDFVGRVKSVDAVGKQANDVTLYEVLVSVNDPADLLPGMNVFAKIMVD